MAPGDGCLVAGVLRAAEFRAMGKSYKSHELHQKMPELIKANTQKSTEKLTYQSKMIDEIVFLNQN